MEPKLYHYGVEFSITQTPIEKKRLHSHCRFGIIVFSLSDFIPMMPPICAICYRDFRHSSDEGGLLRFKLTDAQKNSINDSNSLALSVIKKAIIGFVASIMQKQKKSPTLA